MMDWHKRFVQQAAWTNELRAYLFKHTGLESARRVLEVGCGTGAILADLNTPAVVHALDREPTRLMETKSHSPQAILTCGDALFLPYAPDIFDVTFCHFLLLWVRHPLQALQEMKRVTRSGGNILALAEPDYNGRVDKPDGLAPLGHWQAEALRHQGADPAIGVLLADFFHQAGIPLVETGCLREQRKSPPTPEEWELEWGVLEADLAGLVPAKELIRLKDLDEKAWQRHERVLNVPTYFAWGQKAPMV
jgi:SAM-dependent methyltransferase